MILYEARITILVDAEHLGDGELDRLLNIAEAAVDDCHDQLARELAGYGLTVEEAE
jgi:hypothetical protein